MALLSESYSQQSKYVAAKNEKRDQADMVSGLVKTVFAKLKTRFDDFAKDFNDHLRPTMASAYYMVTREKMANSKQPYFGLPWTIWSELRDIAASKSATTCGRTKHVCVLNDFRAFMHRDAELCSQSLDNGPLLTIMGDWVDTIRRNCYISSIDANDNDLVKQFVQQITIRAINEVGYEDKKVSGQQVVATVFDRIVAVIHHEMKKGDASIIDSGHTSLAISSLMALYQFYRTRDIGSIGKEASDDCLSNKLMTTCIDVSDSSRKGCQEKMNKFVCQARRMNGCTDIVAKIYEHGVQYYHGQQFYDSVALVSATGTRQFLFRLRNLLTDPRQHRTQ